MPNRLLYSSFAAAAVILTACTGLMASASSDASLRLGVSPDSAYRRARTNLGTELFTIVEQDSVHRWIKAIRYPSKTAQPNSGLACHLHLTLRFAGEDLSTTGLWTSDAQETTEAGKTACAAELAETRERVEKFTAMSK
jgi:hypothetical protein